jgi:predicted Rossmann-fold nucleotide-binding protein
MSDRMNTMFNHVNAFIALPGGLDTLEEIFHIFSWAQLHIHHKPIGLLNVNGFL